MAIAFLRRRPVAVASGSVLGVSVGAATMGWLAGTPGAVAFLAAVLALALGLGSYLLAGLLREIERLKDDGVLVAADSDRQRSVVDRLSQDADFAVDDFRAVQRRQVDRSLRAGRGAHRKGDLKKALDHYVRALEWDPGAGNVRRWHRQAALEVAQEPKGVARLVRELDDQVRIENPAHALDIAEAAYANGIDHRDLLDRLIALRDHDGQVDEALALTERASAAHVQVLGREPSESAEARRLDTSARVMISGYFYSGSGAVKDHLRGVPSTTVWPPAGELRVVKFPGGFADLGTRLSDQDHLGAQDLVDHFLHLSGVKVSRKALGHYDRWRQVNTDSRRLHRARPAADGYLAALYRSYQELLELAGSGELDPGRLEAHAQTTLAAAFDAVATANETDRVVVDQIVTAWKIDIARYLPPSTFVIVHRDPRDQYTEVREVLSQPGRGKRRRKPAVFAASYRKDRQFVDTWVARLERDHGHRILRLAFEDFVLDHEATAARLHDTLGIDGASLGKSRFDPAESRRNVGKYRQHLKPAAIEVLESELPEYLHPGVT